MEDKLIVNLYMNRNELAITETQQKYGYYCQHIAFNLLGIQEDAEECVNDTYLAAWNKIPPEEPFSLKAFLGKITRNLAISRYRTNHAKKNYNPMAVLLSELDDCVPSNSTVESAMEQRHISESISDWLESLSSDDCALFVRRYWYGDEVKILAKEYGCTPNQMAGRMLRLRKLLKVYLEKEEIVL